MPGWDCHGLPIEWKVEEEYRKKKLDKDDVPKAQFRAECRAYAEKWVAVQSEQFQRLGVQGEWDDPYLTMKHEAEAKIVEELLKFAESGQLYRGAKPVMWSPVEKTALAEAEVEYEDIVSTQIDVGVRDRRKPDPGVGRRPCGDLDDHALDHSGQSGDRLWAGGRICSVAVTYRRIGRRFLIAEDSLSTRYRRIGPADSVERRSARIGMTTRRDLLVRAPTSPAPSPATRCTISAASSPARARSCPAISSPPTPAPASSICRRTMARRISWSARRHGIDPVFAVEGDGKYRPDWAWLGGQGSVINNKFNAPDGPICTDLREAGALARRQRRFPALLSAFSWRSKAKVIYRCTPQWFIPMDRPAGRASGRRRWCESVRRRADARPRQGQWPDPARDRARRDRAHALGARALAQPHPRHGRGPARLGDQPPARLGRADRALREPQDRRISQGPGGQFADHPRLPRRRRRRLVRRRSPGLARQGLRARGLRAAERHSRRLVRIRARPTPM